MRYQQYWRQCAAVLVLCVTALANAQETHIVKSGEPHADIVIDAEAPPMVRLAAQDLQLHVAKMTGATLPIVTEPTAAIHIYVGQSGYTESLGIAVHDLEHDAFVMRSGKNWLALVGRDREFEPKEPFLRRGSDYPSYYEQWDAKTGAKWGCPHTQLYKQYSKELDIWEHDERGSFNAVSHFLRSLGVRWYLPDPLGLIVPERESIVLPSVDRTVHPDFALRYPMQYYRRFGSQPTATREEILWQLRMGFNTGHNVIGLDPPCHGINYVHSREEVQAQHPEYFMLVNGKRDTSFRKVGRPCLSSEGLLQKNVEFLKAMYNVYNEPAFSVQPQDGYGSLCECKLCEGKASPQLGWYGQLSDYVWGYVDRVGREIIKTHPDRKIHCFGYSAYRLPPSQIQQMSPNILVGIAQGRAYFVNPSARKEIEKLRKAWLDKLLESNKQLMIGDYYLHANPDSAWLGLPVFFPRIIATDLKSLKGISIGEFIEVYRNWGIIDLAVCHLNLYVTARYWWDAEQDIDSLLEEYYTLYYGPARDEMKAFIEYSEVHFDEMRRQPEPISKALELLDAAVAKAPADSVYAKRIGLIVKYLEPMRKRREQLQVARANTPIVRTAVEDPKKIVMDGRFDDPIWAGVQLHRLKDLQDGSRPKFPGSFHVIWAGDSMYFAIHCKEPDTANMIIKGTSHDDTKVWNGDAIELLIETQLNNYYQIAINPAGTVLDLDRSGDKLGMLWSSHVEVATYVGDGYWNAEVRIPVVDANQFEVDPANGMAGRKPSATHPWYFNICRQRIRGDDVSLSAYWPTGKRSFHETMSFSELQVK